MPSINDSKCVLVIGATAGIGRALALAIHKLPSKPTVIVAGRRQERLDEIVQNASNANGDTADLGKIHAVRVDGGADKAELKKFVDGVLDKHPELDTIIFAAGVQNIVDFTKPEEIDLDKIAQETNLNYLSIFSLITLFLPHLLKLNRPALICPISSGLAIIPAARVANYCATKAALHSLCISLKSGLSETNVSVMEIMPPLVESELHDHQGTTPMLSKLWMPLDEYTKLTIEGLQRGDFNVVVPKMQPLWDKFEKERVDYNPAGAFNK